MSKDKPEIALCGPTENSFSSFEIICGDKRIEVPISKDDTAESIAKSLKEIPEEIKTMKFCSCADQQKCFICQRNKLLSEV